MDEIGVLYSGGIIVVWILEEVWAGIMMIDGMQKKNISQSTTSHKWKIKTNLKVLGNGDWELCRSMYEIIVITFDASWIILLSFGLSLFHFFIGISCFRLDYLYNILSFFHWHFLVSIGLFLSLAFLHFDWSEDGSSFSDEPTKGPHDSGAQKLMPKIK